MSNLGRKVVSDNSGLRRLTDVVEPGHLGPRFAAGYDTFAISLRFAASSFFRLPPIRPSARAAARPRRCSLADHGAFELGEGPDHLHHHAPRRSGGVDVLGNRAKAGLRAADPLHDV
jgi:hypothetical protein